MEIEILNVRLPSEIVAWLDSLVERGVYKSRSEAIREFCRHHVKPNTRTAFNDQSPGAKK